MSDLHLAMCCAAVPAVFFSVAILWVVLQPVDGKMPRKDLA